MSECVVTVAVLAYNHRDYIERTLQGILSQKTNFRFEVIVHDDCSIDGTGDIIRKYAEKYPDIIKPVIQKENQFSKDSRILYRFVYPIASGEFFAICEGDDYWIDENKLQIQVDFLKNNPEFSGCFHQSERKNILTGETLSCMPSNEQLKGKDEFDINDTVFGYFIETCSVMYRFSKYKKELLEIYPNNIINGDTFLIYFFSIQGKIKYIDKLMSVKTINESGIWNSVKQSIDEKNVRFALSIINFPIIVNNLFKKYNINLPYETPESAMRRVLNSAINIKRFDIAQKAAENFPEIFKKLITPNEPNYDYYKKKIKKYKKISLFLSVLCIIFVLSLIIAIVL